MAHIFKKSRPMSTPSTSGRLPRLPHPGAHRKSCHPKLSWKKVATFGPGPPGLRFGKVGSDMVDFLWASTVGQPQLPHVFWRFRATVDGSEIRRSPVDNMENLPFTGFLFTSQVVIAGFLNHQQDFGVKFWGDTSVFQPKMMKNVRVRCQLGVQ